MDAENFLTKNTDGQETEGHFSDKLDKSGKFIYIINKNEDVCPSSFLFLYNNYTETTWIWRQSRS